MKKSDVVRETERMHTKLAKISDQAEGMDSIDASAREAIAVALKAVEESKKNYINGKKNKKRWLPSLSLRFPTK